MHLSLSIPSYTHSSVQLEDVSSQDDTTATDSSQDGSSYPLSRVATPPSIRHAAFDTSIPNWADLHAKDHHILSRKPRKRTVTTDDSMSTFKSSYKRARIKSTNQSSITTGQQQQQRHDTNFYFNNTAFPSPSPTPISQPSIDKQEKELQLIQQTQDNQQKGLQSLHQRIKDPSVVNALWQLPSIVNTFDTLPTSMKTYFLFQLLKRSSTSSLQFVNSLITPILKRDFLATLPHELALQVIRHLDARSLCRAATVSKTWRSIIDYDRATWRSLMHKDQLADMDESEDKKEFMSQYDDHNDATTSRESTSEPMDIDDDDDIEHVAECRYHRQQRYHSDEYGANDDNNDNDNDNDNDNSDNGDHEHEHDDNCDSDGHSSDDGTDKGKATLLPPINNPYKINYRQKYILRENWRKGHFKRISFPGKNSLSQSVVTCLQFDEEKIISGVDDRVINIYQTKTGKHISTLRGHEGGVWALQYVGNTLVSGSTDRTIRVWDIERAVCTHVFLGHTSTVRCLQIVMPTMVNGRLEPAHPLIITGSRDFTVRVWRLPDPRKDPPFNGNGVNPWYMHTLTGHSLSVRAITAHGNTLVSGSYDNTVSVWNLETGRLIHRMEGHNQKVYAVVIDPDRKRCMSGSMDGSVRVWDLVTGQCLQSLEGHSILVGLLGLTKNYLVSAAADGTLRVWSPDTGICQNVLSGHKHAITCFQHDEHKVISGSEGGLKMWDVKSGRHIKDLITGVDGVWRVAFDKYRCVAAVYKNEVTSFEVLDFSPPGEDDS